MKDIKKWLIVLVEFKVILAKLNALNAKIGAIMKYAQKNLIFVFIAVNKRRKPLRNYLNLTLCYQNE